MVLAETVRVRSVSRQEALAGEIKAYAAALLQARMGVLSTAREAPRAIGSAGGDFAPAQASSDPSGAEPAATQRGGAVVRHGQRDAVSSVMLDRFCQLTGISRSHIGGNGSNLAGIAFYFGAFAILTAGRDIALEQLERLLDQLRACREAVDRFVAHRLVHVGWSRSEQGKRDLQAALRALEAGVDTAAGGG